MNKHVEVVEDGIDAECAWEECGHEDDCPIVRVAACQECYAVAMVDGDEYTAIPEWPCEHAETGIGDTDEQ